MKKRWFAFLMVSLLLVSTLAVPAYAEDGADEGSGVSASSDTDGGSKDDGSGGGSGSDSGEGSGTGSGEGSGSGSGEGSGSGSGEGSGSGSGEGSGSGSGEGSGSGSGEGSGSGSGEGSGSGSGEGSSEGSECKHVWVEVTVPATCMDVGGVCNVCSVCEAVVVKAVLPVLPHTYDSTCDPDCNVCGFTRDASHKPAAGWDYNSTKHWHVCAVCGAKTGEANHYPGPAATEDKDQICLTCGKVMTTKRSHTHDKESKWTSDETGHWHACKSCDEKLDFEAHALDGECGTPCTKCGYVSKDGHIYGELWYFSANEHWKVCTQCGAEDSRAPHTPDPETGICTVCANTSTAETTQATDHVHEFGDSWMNDSDTHWQVCACGEKSAPSAHAWKVSGPDEDGVITFVCNTCQYEKTEQVEITTEENAGFPFMILFVIFGVVIIGLVVALLAVLGVFKPKKKKSGHFSK